MVEIRWNKMFLLLMLVLQFNGALSRQLRLSYIIREGDEATLSCENVVKDHNDCDTTTWLFSNSRNTVELIDLGQVKNETNKNRLSLTANCSLVIKKVTVEDAGRYTCRQFISGTQQGEAARVDLSVVTVTGHKDTDKVTLSCSVETNQQCYTVKWLYMGRDVEKNHSNIKISESSCSAKVNILNNFWGSSIPIQDFRNWFKCSVSTEDNKNPLTFSLRPSDEDTKTTTTTIIAKTTTTITTTTASSLKDLWWLFIVVPVVIVAFLIIAVKVIRSRRSKGKNVQRNDNVALTSEPAVAQSAPETSQDMADPEDGVSYASISYTRTANSKAKIWSKKDDDDTVTYSTVKASSPDPSSLYATINNPNSGP